MRRRPPRFDEQPGQKRHRVNRDIRFPQIRVIAPDGEQLGVMDPDEARSRAEELGLDLVEVAPNARPPVCRIMDYGKFLYNESKKASQTTSSHQDIKTIQVRPKTDDHDLETKLRRAEKFLERGDKVKLVMRMRGRERAYPARWIEKLQEHVSELGAAGHVAKGPVAEGRVITLMLEPGADA